MAASKTPKAPAKAGKAASKKAPAKVAPEKAPAAFTDAALVAKHEAKARKPARNAARLGVVRNQASGAEIAVLDNRTGAIIRDKAAIWPWLVVCLDHGTVQPAPTVVAAMALRTTPVKWCAECKKAAAAKARAAKANGEAKAAPAPAQDAPASAQAA